MVYALLLAGGVGKRMNHPIPKQFIEVFGRPVISYTLDVFQNNPNIDKVIVSCNSNWIEYLKNIVSKYKHNKVFSIVEGGDIAQESIRNGIFALEEVADNDDIVLIAMSVQPLIDNDVINDSIKVCMEKGNAIAADQSIYSLGYKTSCEYTNEYVLKENVITINMPWTFKYKKLLWAYKKAYAEKIDIGPQGYTSNLMIDLGEKLYFSKDNQKNKIKITTLDDIDLFRGYLLATRKEIK